MSRDKVIKIGEEIKQLKARADEVQRRALRESKLSEIIFLKKDHARLAAEIKSTIRRLRRALSNDGAPADVVEERLARELCAIFDGSTPATSRGSRVG